jgi:TIR domain
MTVSPQATGLIGGRAVTDNGADARWDFFISYTQADSRWAEWIAWQLSDAGYHVVIQAWHFVAGSNWTAKMGEAMQSATRTVAVISPSYLNSVYGSVEWQDAWRKDPDGTARKLVPVRVEPSEPEGQLGQLVYIDLFNLDENGTRERLLDGVRGALDGDTTPSVSPNFPGGVGKWPTP